MVIKKYRQWQLKMQRCEIEKRPSRSIQEYNLLNPNIQEVKRMLEMTRVNYIKFLREKESLNITEIANRHKRNWRKPENMPLIQIKD